MSNSTIISPNELQGQLASETPPILLDVRLKDDFDAEHIVGAKSNCVFEVAFQSRLEESGAQPSQPICVYGANASSHESRMAVEKLERAGFQTIYELREGLEGWSGGGLETVTGTPLPSPAKVADGPMQVDLEESKVEWLGRNLINKHWGEIRLKSGELEFKNGELVGGEFVLDMNQMTSTDLAGNDLHDVLIDHLKSDDFFDVERFPEARFKILSSERIADRVDGASNLKVTGEMTIKGVSHVVDFEASAGLTADNGKPAAQAAIAIDRTLWDVIYGSGKWFHRLAGHLVNDMVELQLRVVAA